ncbi:MAG: hypothetical protein ACXVJK_08685 [Candidatus Aminicenantales bacterium]
MKRTSLVLILLFCAGTAFSADRLLVSAGLNYLQTADSGYKGVYGQSLFYPDARVGVRIVRGLHAVAGFGFLTKKGETPDLHLPAKSTQMFYSAGLAYIANVGGMVNFKVEAGVADISYKEEAMDLIVKGSKLGYQAELGLLIMGDVAFTEIDLGYVGAADTVAGVNIKLGGARAALRIGFRI